MIHYQLRCVSDHEFEGWFSNSSSFEDQAARGLLSCPYCGTAGVDRALMAPAVRSSRQKKDERQETPVTPAEVPAATVVGQAGIPDALLSTLQKMRQEVESKCENVGDRFAEEALRIHHGEAEERGIYGRMTPDDHERLEDEGVSVQRLPWVQPAEG
ncbi:DUF1178 family protein [Acetobacter sp.]|jgi:hypothetical protein|uniref:DUF1178 family protein n=1 Tax=Acetobacter sp. TaxID=440 RepID=UPI0025BB7E6D|nr:DUF1178 family protein [Acetobacter sp.]MCH4090457.1 DUF1178 family protein [Acetobacter sp.]MCI1299151.1 DUF1178 family protein [Acetobacter sp.]MCI1315698.1 DUF1178 family protein [Acetobacter sp.]